MKPIGIGADYAGADLKTALQERLVSLGYDVEDYGAGPDYPDVAIAVAEAVARGNHDRAILVCGTGIGMAIAANKIPGVRAAQLTDSYSAERARKSNNAQIASFGSRVITVDVALDLLSHWLSSEFEGGRSAPKVAKLDALDASRGAGRLETTHGAVHPQDITGSR
jgi:ribose 5-phosphate isomerase B